ncbi:MAG: DUF2807 domain-containing protein [Bacteroidetes bacterium]|nr:DUF2807 domain-containing protein [Bacteroidota bacterium]
MTHARHLLFLLTISLCLHCGAVTGDGQVTTVKRKVGQFTTLTIDGPFQIVTSDDPYSDFFIATEADQNLQQYIDVTETAAAAHVRLRPGTAIERYTKLIIHVDIRTIQSLAIHAITDQRSDITMPVICHGGQLKVTGSIPITIHVKVACHKVAHLPGPEGALQPGGINYTHLVAEINNARTTTLTGDIEEMDILHTGSGQLSAYELKADLVRIRHTTLAPAEVYSDHELQITGSGGGYVYYRGAGRLSSINLSAGAVACHEEGGPPIASSPPVVPLHTGGKKLVSGFDTDSLFAEMILRDQAHRRNGVTTETVADDSINFELLRWYMARYGYPIFEADSLMGMSAALFMHIDRRDHFELIKTKLQQAVRDGKMLANTYAYTCDRCMIAGQEAPVYYYFPPGSDFDLKYVPQGAALDRANRDRADIGLPPYHSWLHGKYF